MSNPAIPDGPARDALAAVFEALDVPHGATVADQEARNCILVQRAGHARAMLAGILGGDTFDAVWQVAYLRGRLAEHPAEGYTTWQQRMAELDAAQATA